MKGDLVGAVSVRARSAGPRPAARSLLRWPVGLAAWSGFGFGWWSVIHRNAAVDVRVVVGLAALAILVLLVTLLWIRRNRRIYRVKGPRSQVSVPTAPAVSDRLGRQLVIEPAAGRASEVVLRVTPDGRKTYEPVGVEQ